MREPLRRPLPSFYNRGRMWGSGIGCTHVPTPPHYVGAFPMQIDYLEKGNRPRRLQLIPARGPRVHHGGAQPAVSYHRTHGLAGPLWLPCAMWLLRRTAGGASLPLKDSADASVYHLYQVAAIRLPETGTQWVFPDPTAPSFINPAAFSRGGNYEGPPA